MDTSRGRRVLLVDGLLALLLLAASLAASALASPGGEEVLAGAGTVLVAAACLATWWRRLEPIVVLGGVLALVATSLLADYPHLPMLLPLLAALYAVGAHTPTQRSVVAAAGALVVTLTAFSVATLLLPQPAGDDQTGARLAAWAGWVVAPWALGVALRLRRELTAAQQVAGELDDTARAATARAAAAGQRCAREIERVHLARDAHDAVGDDLAAISMRADAALHVADHRPGDARLALHSVLHRTDASLHVLRRARGGLRDEGPLDLDAGRLGGDHEAWADLWQMDDEQEAGAPPEAWWPEDPPRTVPGEVRVTGERRRTIGARRTRVHATSGTGHGR